MERPSNFDYMQNYRTPENQRRMVWEINILQNSIVDYAITNDLLMQSSGDEGWEVSVNTEDDLITIKTTDISGGAQIDTTLTHYLYNTTLYQTTGIRTNDILHVSFYPDRKTYNQIQKEEKFPYKTSLSIIDSMIDLERIRNTVLPNYPKELLSRFFDWGSLYLTDEEGKIAKFGVIPEYLLDDRNNIELFENNIEDAAIVEYPVQLRDFSNARAALVNMQNTLASAYKKRRNNH